MRPVVVGVSRVPVVRPGAAREDLHEYLLRAINGAVTTKITEADILGTWAGLRPLVAAAKSERTADLSRRASVKVAPSNMVTVTGGKLTTYRRMAADAVDDLLVEVAGVDPPAPARGRASK